MKITPKEAAKRLGVTSACVRMAIRRGELQAVRVLGRLRLDAEEIDRIAAGVPVAAPMTRSEGAASSRNRQRLQPAAVSASADTRP